MIVLKTTKRKSPFPALRRLNGGNILLVVLRVHLLTMLIPLLVCGLAAQNEPPQPVKASPNVSQGLLIHKVQPIYPERARRSGVQGTVVLEALIDKDGTIRQVTVISGHPMLIQAAEDAVKQWRYKPYYLNGEPVLVRTTINVNFQLSGAPSEPQAKGQAANGSSSNNGAAGPPLEKEELGQRGFRFVSPDRKFEVSFPGQPNEEEIPSDSGPFHMEGRAYSFQDGTAKFVLSYIDLTPFPTDLKAGDALDAAISGTVGNVKGMLVRQQLLTLMGVPAKSVLIAVADNTILEGQFLCVKPRVYQLLVLHGKDMQPPFEQQFFDSFTIPMQATPASSLPSTQAAQDSKGVYRVGGGVTAPKVTYAPDPRYSEQARAAHYEGSVVLWLVVDTKGLPQEVKVQRSLGMGLDEEAIKAVKQWRFQPATKDGKPVPVMINVQVNFRLK
jgi:TonB family protein